MNGLRIGILGNADGWYVRDLQRACIHESIEVLSFKDLRTDLGTQASLHAHCEDKSDRCSRRLSGVDADFDVLLVRTMPLGSVEQIIFRMNALQIAERHGVLVVNSPRCLEIAIDKWLTLDRLAKIGIPSPRTCCCQTREDAMLAWESLGGDCVVKPLFGGEGRGLMRVDNPDLAWRVFGTLEQLQSIIYLQTFVPHPGYDLRLLVLGQTIYAVKRMSQGDWRTNVSRGGEAVPHEASDQEREMALCAAKELGGLIVGVDLLRGLDGTLHMLEVNAVPGWRGTARALGVDIARHLLNDLNQLRDPARQAL